MRALDDLLRDVALRRGLHLSRATPRPAVFELLSQLWPTYDPSRLARYGAEGDGGYLMPDDLDGVTACVSPGVADSVEFEIALAEIGIPSFLVDASIDELPKPVPGSTFTRQFVSSRTEGNLVTLTDLFAAAPSGDLVLQLDVEGDEYQVLASTPMDVLQRARIIVVELHDLFSLFEPVAGPFMINTVSRLLTAFGVAHVHANNMDGMLRVDGRRIPRAMEVTFVRLDAMVQAPELVQLPHHFDRPCVLDRPDFVPVLRS